MSLKYLLRSLLQTSIQEVYNIQQEPKIRENMQQETATLNKQLISLCQQFCLRSTPQIQKQLKQSSWQDIYTLISHPNVDNNVRVVSCSVLKWLIYHKKFVADPMLIFHQLVQFYLTNNHGDKVLAKAQEIAEFVIEVIPGSYFKQKQKQTLIQQLIGMLAKNPGSPEKIRKLIDMLLQSIQPQRINNEVLTGQVLLVMQQALTSSTLESSLRLSLTKNGLKLIQNILQILNNDDEIQTNIVEEFLVNSNLAKGILEKIISDCSNGQQIICTDRQVNELKVIALEVYSSIWVYALDQHMFKLFFSTIVTKPNEIIDQQIDIMERVVTMLERSITTQAYYDYLHKHSQSLTISLLRMLKPKQSSLRALEEDPEDYVDQLYDFCMQQQRETLQNKVGNLISSLSLYIDGYLSFLGSICIMTIKKFNGTVQALPGGTDFMQVVQAMWTDSLEHRAAICVMVLSAISDQLDKRQDLAKPLKVQLLSMSNMFKYPQCKLPTYLICNFMMLYSFQGYPGCLNEFLPYKPAHPVYIHQLQCCYKIMLRYYSRYPECKKYLDQICNVIIVSDTLTPLLQTTILTGDVNLQVQFQILERLVGWIQEGITKESNVICSKIGNLMAILIERMKVDDYKTAQDACFAYLHPLLKLLFQVQYSQFQQFLLEPSIAFIKKFPSLQKNPERLMYFIELGFKIIQRNNGVLNNCLDLFFEISHLSNYELTLYMIQILMGCLHSQQRETDQWQCYYGLQICMLRVGELGKQPPQINLKAVLDKIGEYSCQILKVKAFMFVMSTLASSPPTSQLPIQADQIPIEIVPYQSKPFTLYLLHILPQIKQSPEQSQKLLKLLIKNLQRQKGISKQIKKYEEQLYERIEESSQVATDAYGITRKLIHPLLLKNIDVFVEFRKCWDLFPNKEVLVGRMKEEDKKVVMDFVGQVTINHRVRKIYRVKHSNQDQMS